MSQWAHNHPELVGTDADPWMIHESYRRCVPPSEAELERLREERFRMDDREFCGECGGVLQAGDGTHCGQCRQYLREPGL